MREDKVRFGKQKDAEEYVKMEAETKQTPPQTWGPGAPQDLENTEGPPGSSG